MPARGIGSARELARRSVDSAAFGWLCGGATVNHRLLSDFRTDRGAGCAFHAGDCLVGGQGCGAPWRTTSCTSPLCCSDETERKR